MILWVRDSDQLIEEPDTMASCHPRNNGVPFSTGGHYRINESCGCLRTSLIWYLTSCNLLMPVKAKSHAHKAWCGL